MTTATPLDGYLLIDKPTGISSFDVIRRLKKILPDKRPDAKRAKDRRYKLGHTGTLDPLATGLLVVCVGESTKAVPWLVGADKSYDVRAQVGYTSETYDSTGTLTPVPTPEERPYRDPVIFQRVLDSFKGDIRQQAPAYSAIHIDGERAYARARRGEDVVMPYRSVRVDDIEILDNGDTHFSLRIRCGSGTYIRSLVHDIGQSLGVGAVMTDLRRTQCGLFDVSAAQTLPQAMQLFDEFDKLSDREQALRAQEIVKDIFSGFPNDCVADMSTDDWHQLCLGRAIHPLDSPKARAASPLFRLRRHSDADSTAFALLRHIESGSAAFIAESDGQWHPKRILNVRH